MEDIVSPAGYTEGIAPSEPCQPKGPYQLRDKYGA